MTDVEKKIKGAFVGIIIIMVLMIVGGVTLAGALIYNCDKVAQEVGGIAAEVEMGYQDKKDADE